MANFFSSLLLIILPLKHFTIKQKNFDKVTIDQLFFINRASDPFILLKWHINIKTAYWSLPTSVSPLACWSGATCGLPPRRRQQAHALSTSGFDSGSRSAKRLNQAVRSEEALAGSGERRGHISPATLLNPISARLQGQGHLQEGRRSVRQTLLLLVSKPC